MFTIGEFSKITGLTIKTLRFYHEKEILVPSLIDEDSRYRYYSSTDFGKAKAIKHLRNMMFSISDIQDILKNYQDESELVEFLEKQKTMIEEKLYNLQNISLSLGHIIKNEKEVKKMISNKKFEIEEKEVDNILIAGHRWKGKYSDTGNAFSLLGKKYGRYISGKPLNLYYDMDFKEDDADIESCFPLRKGKTEDDVNVRMLEGGKCISLIHKGPYEQISISYKRIFEYIKNNGFEIKGPIRELYLKGPGMIFKGNPKNYLTELQMFF